jgi:hypothetical protein
VTYRSGEATMTAGNNTIAVTFSSPMPNTTYSVTVTPASVVNWGSQTIFSDSVPNTPVFYVITQTTTGFTIESENGNATALKVPTGSSATFDWHAIENN